MDDNRFLTLFQVGTGGPILRADGGGSGRQDSWTGTILLFKKNPFNSIKKTTYTVFFCWLHKHKFTINM